jgi:hypothetical protein
MKILQKNTIFEAVMLAYLFDMHHMLPLAHIQACDMLLGVDFSVLES